MPSISDTLQKKLVDQLFSIVLLVGYALYSNKKQQDMDDKMNKYLTEDRAKMLEVIGNNTRAFENFTIKYSVNEKIPSADRRTFVYSAPGLCNRHL